MLEVRRFGERTELVSDDARGENLIVSEALEGTPLGHAWDEAPFEDGELVVAIQPLWLRDTAVRLADADYCAHVADELLGIADELQPPPGKPRKPLKGKAAPG